MSVSGLEASRTELLAQEDVIPFSGIVAWSDRNRPYGFVVPRRGTKLGHVFVHKKCVERSGFAPLFEGNFVTGEAERSPKGLLKAVRILSVEYKKTALSATCLLKVEVGPIGDLERATVKFHDPGMGYGFVVLEDGGTEAMVHSVVLRYWGLQRLKRGKDVLVRCASGPNGLMVVELRLGELAVEAQ